MGPMPLAKTEADVRKRIMEIEEKLSTISEAARREMERPYFERRNGTFNFLHWEKRVYRAVLQELQSLLDG